MAAVGFAQEPEPGTSIEVDAEPVPNVTFERVKDDIVITVRQDAEIKDFLDGMANVIGRPVIYDPRNNRINKQEFGTVFKESVNAARFFDTCRSILIFYELVLVQVGPRGNEIFLVLDSRSTNNIIKNKALPVPYAELEEYADRDGLFISCAIPIKNITNLTTLRTALSSMTSTGGIGRVHEVPGSNSIIINDFAPTVAAMARLIRSMDQATQEATMAIEVVELEHAEADEVAEALTKLVVEWVPGVAPQVRGRPQYGHGQNAVRPTIVPFEHRNAVIISANPDHAKRLKDLIATLDQPAKR
jgi:type II secretory pathway component GspD/PulD (secretin)